MNEVAMMERRLAELGHVVVGYEQYSRDVTELEQVVAIVRAIAETSAPYDHEYSECLLCDNRVSRIDPVSPEDHDPSCPWRQAVEWVQAHAASEEA